MNEADKQGGAEAEIMIAKLRDQMPKETDSRVQCPHCGRKFNDSK
jgi:predicted  nucleic acid-binding Zn-ribbon protein